MSPLIQWIHQLHYTTPTPWWWWMLMILPSWGYRMGVGIRQWLYQQRFKKAVYLPVPVISIGNLTTGGTGKTPMTVAIAHYLHHDLNLRVGILSRGYGASEPQTYAQAHNPNFGDEAFMIQKACPFATVIVGRKRCENALRLVKEHPIDVLVLDDGFQYLPLARDLNVLLIDDTARLGNGYSLPLGPLREPLASIRRADSLLMTRTQCPQASQAYLQDIIKKAKTTKTEVDVVVQRLTGMTSFEEPKRVSFLADLKQKPVLLFTGIGNPQQFVASLEAESITLLETLILADHQALEGASLEQFKEKWMKYGKPLILCTHKDAVKLHAETLGEMAGFIRCVEFELILPESLKMPIKRFMGLTQRQNQAQASAELLVTGN
jgi:tetraacyldisaccharide 4'-kinase